MELFLCRFFECARVAAHLILRQVVGAPRAAARQLRVIDKGERHLYARPLYDIRCKSGFFCRFCLVERLREKVGADFQARFPGILHILDRHRVFVESAFLAVSAKTYAHEDEIISRVCNSFPVDLPLVVRNVDSLKGFIIFVLIGDILRKITCIGKFVGVIGVFSLCRASHRSLRGRGRFSIRSIRRAVAFKDLHFFSGFLRIRRPGRIGLTGLFCHILLFRDRLLLCLRNPGALCSAASHKRSNTQQGQYKEINAFSKFSESLSVVFFIFQSLKLSLSKILPY